MKFAERPDTVLTRFHGMVTVSPQMREFFALLTRVSRTDASILIRGETGTGKELAASAIHALSPRRGGAFRALNCATLTAELLASELFGHVRGAFTDGPRERRGLFTLADKGTIFLDEVAEMPLGIQARLLRVLQEKRFTPVGATDPVQSDVRVLSATNKALRDEVASRRFREDLMYRIRVVPIFLPRLIERTGDIAALTWYFIDTFNAQQSFRHITSIDAEVMDAMLAYAWPGNIRELRNVMEHAYAVGEGDVLSLHELPPELRGEPPPRRAPGTAHELERARLLDALQKSQGRKGDAAELLGISRSTLWRKLREHRID